jgi:hypothetical protein
VNIKTIKFISANNFQGIWSIFNSNCFYNEPDDIETVLAVRIQVDGQFDDFSANNLQDLSRKCQNKSILIFLASKNHEKFAIYWKSKDISQFITFEHYKAEFEDGDSEIYEFIVDFLINALSKGELG